MGCGGGGGGGGGAKHAKADRPATRFCGKLLWKLESLNIKYITLENWRNYIYPYHVCGDWGSGGVDQVVVVHQ
jgi:hypothetical protein